MSKFLEFPLDLNEIASVKLPLNDDFEINRNEYPGYPGLSNYKLLSYLSSTFDNGTIINFSDDQGCSLALCSNQTNQVYSFYQENNEDEQEDEEKKKLHNNEVHEENLYDNEVRSKWESKILESKLIFLDTAPHLGMKEYEFYQYLLEHDYQGLLIVDDIWYFKGMRDNFWYQIPSYQKCDITKYGHWAGVGIIKVSESPFKAVPLNKRDNRSWTFVTGYFDLTRCKDATKEIKDRSSNFYLQSANTTMGLDANLIVFCEPEYQSELEKLRPDHLKSQTKYITCRFEDFPMNKYRNKIQENRIKNPSKDPRNTPSYYLFCMARYAMVKQAIAENPFDSTHFSWVNICIERYGFKNVMALEDVMAEYRDKFSTCYIDYQPKELVEKTSEYFEWGRCSLCSGFFTGNTHYFKIFCDLIEQQFVKYVDLGYGHADEQLYSPIYFGHPEIFEVYFGDYQSMVTNYVRIVDDVQKIINIFIAHSLQHKNFQVCYFGCKAVWNYCYQNHPNRHRKYSDPLNTSILGQSRNLYLKALLLSSREVGDWDLAHKALIEIQAAEYGF